LARFWKAWYSYLVTKGLGVSNMTLCYTTTQVWELRFKCSRDARYSFSLRKVGEWPL
jgi:hypothetical protein